jgi:hypothetical protein
MVHRVLADGEDGRLRPPDPLAFEEVGVDAGGVVDPAAGELLRNLPRPFEVGLDHPHADALLGERARDRRPDLPAAEDDDILDDALTGGEQRSPGTRGARRPDHHDPVAFADLVLTARQRHRALSDQREHARVVGDARLAERAADDGRVGPLRDLELDDLHLAVREDVRLPRRRHPDRARDGVSGLELRRDGEVDVEPALPPEVDVLDVRRPDHDRRARRLDAGERAGDEIHLVARRARDEEVGSRRPRLLDREAAGTVRLDRAEVVAVGERLQPVARRVDHREVVLAVKRLDDGRPDLPCTDDDDLHAAAEPTPPDTWGHGALGALALGCSSPRPRPGSACRAERLASSSSWHAASSPVDVLQAPGDRLASTSSSSA